MGASAIGTSSVGPGVMPAQVLGGPVWWFFFGLYLLTIAFAVFTLVDSLRGARRERFKRIIEPRWLYPGFSAVYLLCVFAAWIPGLPRVLTAVPVGLALPMLAVGFAYLLRVVFPNEPVGEAPLGGDAGGGGQRSEQSESPARSASDTAGQSDGEGDSYFDA